MISLKSLIPTPQQFRNWSLPSKVGYIGFILTIIPFAVALIEHVGKELDSRRYNYELVQKQLEAHAIAKNFDALSKSLHEIKGREELGDLYNFYTGYYVVNSPLMTQDPSPYFQRVSPRTTLYVAAKQNVLSYYQHQRKSEFVKVRQEIAAEVKKTGEFFYFYYLLMVMDANEDADISKFDRLRAEFIEKFEKQYDFSTHKQRDLVVNQKQPTINIELFHIQPLEMAHFLLYRNRAKAFKQKEKWLWATRQLAQIEDVYPMDQFKSWATINFNLNPIEVDKVYEYGRLY